MLVTALLVLLVIIATAYLGRTRAERVVATAQQQAALRDGRASVIADDLAREIADALFVRPINKAAVLPITSNVIADSNLPRLTIAPDSVRHGVDSRNTDQPGAPAVLGYEYNFAPFHVVPSTNWPDLPQYPRGSNNAAGVAGLIGESNPVGYPGYGDLRWLRAPEPERIRVDPTAFGLNVNDELFVYSHWRKLSNVARAENGWRAVYDISNVMDSVVTELNAPIEQWLAFPYPGTIAGTPIGTAPGQLWQNNSSGAFFTNFGTRQVVSIGAFENQWNLWINSHSTAYQNVNFIPNNFYRLSDLFPGNEPNSFGERPEDEFNGPGTAGGGATGTARWSVSRTLADADGDGYTDSFWFLAPTMVEGGLRQVVAISIVDNGGLVNVNTASRFVRSDTVTGIVGSRTTGQTPADTALIGQAAFNNFSDPLNTWNTGLLDSYLNQSPANGAFFRGTQVRFRPEMWATNQTATPVREINLLGQLGVKGNLAFPDLLGTQIERVRFFRSLGSRLDEPRDGLTPFGAADELELRKFASSNSAETLSRLERAVDTRVYDPIGAGFVGPGNQQVILRSDDFLEESSDWFDRLSVPDLVRDVRRKVTTHSATRNDLMPPWLWPSSHPDAPQIRYDQVVGNFVYLVPPAADPALGQWRKDWQDRVRKVDLRREPVIGAPPQFDLNAYINAVSDAMVRALVAVRQNPFLPNALLGSSYFGDFVGGPFTGDPDAFRRTRKMVDSYASNIAAARDPDDIPLSADFLINVRPDVVDGDGFARRRFPGMERHPFLVEAFVGHVYPIYSVPVGYPNAGTQVIFSTEPGGPDTDQATTIVVVQIANPFDTPLPLRDLPETTIDETTLTPEFELEIFGQTVPLRDLALVDPQLDRLPPCTDREPRVITLFAIVDAYNGIVDFRTRWLDFLDIPSAIADSGALPWARSIDLNSVPGVSISVARDTYDTYTGPAVQIVRVEPSGGALPPLRLVVDRIDRLDVDPAESFGEVVRELGTQVPPPGPVVLPPIAAPFPVDPSWTPSGIDGNQWVQWRRAARGFGYGRSSTRFNPRYVYGNREITEPVAFVDSGTTPNTLFRDGNIYRVESEPDTPWFGQPKAHWEAIAADALTPVYRKPATFNLRWGETFYDVATAAPVSGDPDVFFPDTGYYHSPVALQMLQRNRDFDRVGDLAWVWLWGPELNIENQPAPFIERTFAEVLSREAPDYPPLAVGAGSTVNRLRLAITEFGGTFGTGNDVIVPSLGGVPVDRSIPALPAWTRVFDAFTCDGAGLNPPDLNGDGTISIAERESARMRLAGGYSGRPVHGLLNVNTAPVETLRAMPHMFRLVDEGIGSFSLNPRTRWAEGIVAYRDRIGDWDPNVGIPVFPDLPPYGGRGEFGVGAVNDGYLPEIRSERGIAALGELLVVDAQPVDAGLDSLVRASWRRSFPARGPFGNGVSTRISTDTFSRFQPQLANPQLGTTEPDFIAGDLEEQTMLFAGLANLATTRSDTFTVHFRIRTFRQDPVSGRWDALKRENIVDDSRYVMVVDRSQVNTPNDRPQILFLEKLPN